ncbi:MAG: ATP-binding cassette domain-containing protein [Zetaproteobacteria bacterium]|nr:ATP-binding cassette domain-containing protein [Zetaproteobacteria bacterium]
MIEVKNLVRRYGNFVAVKGVSFNIPKGQIIGLLGHNGAGKTTTIKVLTGYLEPSEGEVLISGMNIGDHTLDIQNKIGYLPENSPLYPEMTVVEYLSYVANMRGIASESQVAAIQKAIEATDLKPKAGDKIATLSKGYRQRVGVAQAIIHQPEILILDEPTNGLDPTQILAMRNLIKRLSETTTVILSTHIMQEVEAICDRVLIIMDGRVAVDATLEELRAEGQISIALDRNPDEARSVLGAISGVAEISHEQPTSGNTWNYRLKPAADDQNLSAVIAKTVVDKGWNLYGLSREKRNLESIFRDVNAGQGGTANV